MKQLETKLRRKGYDYTQIDRFGDVAIYKQDRDGEFVAFEVFEVRKNVAHVIAGNHIEASESMPTDNQWGQNAYTVHTMDAAMDKVAIIQQAIDNRIKSQENVIA